MKKIYTTLFVLSLLIHFQSLAHNNDKILNNKEELIYKAASNFSLPGVQSNSVPNKVAKWHLIAKTSFYDNQPVPALGASYRINKFHVGLGARYKGDAANKDNSVTPYVELGYNVLNNYSKFYIIPSISLFKYEFIEPKSWVIESGDIPVGKGEISLTTGVKWFFFQFNYLLIKDSKKYNIEKSKHFGGSIGFRFKL
ncbi:hypothetical protein [Marinifilum flexuosum]|uniref:Outer membrane protein with beta-barrel domain n=1 Tax=Marinifilum flexuosum TaxID=1117708 RepID=A0A419X602_9BACT|nr:hypothetical protein [Marinifilum flexuosum]RKE03157.1 hypothetical protein BXY64_0148 [Marinifilum flexuosum]